MSNVHVLTEESRDDETPAVSIVTAAFNVLEGLRRTVENIQSQSFRDFEHIIVDGGSTDDTLCYLESLGNSVRWLSKPDSGIADALNKGIALARGRYIFVLHAADTFLEPTTLESISDWLDGETEVVCCDVILTGKRAYKRLRPTGLWFKINFKLTIPHQGVFVKRSLFERIGNFDTTYKIDMDYDFFLRAYRARTLAVCVPTVLTCMPDTGVSSRKDWASLSQRFAEERRIHMKYCPSPAFRLVYAVYWPLYLLYRRVRFFVTKAIAGSPV